MPKPSNKKYDAVVVLGGGITPETGEVHPWVKNRFDKAAEIPASHLIALSNGTFNLPPVLDKKTGFPILESMAGINYFVSKYGKQGRLFIPDFGSLDTIGNLYFLRLHCETWNLTHLVLITSEFHMPRTQAIAKWIFGLRPIRQKFTLEFVTVPDVGMEEEVRLARIEREQASLKGVQANSKKIRTLAKFAHWLFTEHKAYSPEGWNSRVTLTGPAAKSY